MLALLPHLAWGREKLKLDLEQREGMLLTLMLMVMGLEPGEGKLLHRLALSSPRGNPYLVLYMMALDMEPSERMLGMLPMLLLPLLFYLRVY